LGEAIWGEGIYGYDRGNGWIIFKSLRQRETEESEEIWYLVSVTNYFHVLIRLQLRFSALNHLIIAAIPNIIRSQKMTK
jgi:hypothetical protein